MKSLVDLIDEGEHITTSCPVCGREITLNRDGTLMNHFTSPFNQDNKGHPPCVGGGNMKVVADDRMMDKKHTVE